MPRRVHRGGVPGPADTDHGLVPGFVGREDLVTEFRAHLDAPTGHCPPVLVYHSIGGMGKTSLLHYLRATQCAPRSVPSAWVDFDTTRGSYLSPESALWKIASDLAEAQIPFQRFLVVWGLLYGRRTGQRWQPEESRLKHWGGPCADVAQALSLLPYLGETRKVAEATWKLVGRDVWEWLQGRFTENRWSERSLRSLDESELIRLLPEALGEDLDAASSGPRFTRRHGAPRPVIFLDTYECLQEARTAERPDGFVRVLAEVAGPSLIAVAGRHPLDWADRYPEWRDASKIDQHPLDSLSAEECRQYLRRRGVSNQELAEGLANLSRGFPLALGLAADIALEMEGTAGGVLSFEQFRSRLFDDLSPSLRERLERELSAEDRRVVDLRGAPEELLTEVLLSRFLREVPEEDRPRVSYACVPRYVTDAILQAIWPNEMHIARVRSRLVGYSFVTPDRQATAPRWTLHSIVRESVLSSSETAPVLPELHRRLATHFEGEAARASDGETRFALQLEALYHQVGVEPATGSERLREVLEECLDSRQMSRCAALLAVLDQHEQLGHVARGYRAYCAARMVHVSYGTWSGETTDYRDAALSLLEQALSHQEQAPDSPLKAAMYLRVARLYRDHQRFSEALRWYHRCRDTCTAVHAPLILANCLIEIALTDWTANPDCGNMALIGEGRRLAGNEGAAGTPVVLAAMDGKAAVLADAQRFEEALAAAREGRRLAHQTGHGWWEADLQRRIAELLLRQKAEPARAEQAIAQAERLWRETEAPEGDAPIMRRLRAGLFLLKGDYQAALASFSKCLGEEKTVYKSRYGVATALLDIGRCWERTGDAVAALSHAAVAVAVLEDLEETTVYEALDEQQRMRRAFGDIDEALLATKTAELKREHAPWLLAQDQGPAPQVEP